MTSLARAENLAAEPLAHEHCAVSVETKSGVFGFDCAPGETLLYAGLRHGLTLPHECATGTCGTCRARVMTGEVDVAWEEAPGAARLKRDKGDILLCQTRALGDCVLRVPAEVAEKPARHQIPAYRMGLMENIRRLTSDVVSFEVALSTPMEFDAGQFVVVEAPGLQGARAYSMVNFTRSAGRIELVDVVTPATTRRYTGNHGGSILAWKAFSDADDVASRLVGKERMRLPGLSGFSMAGQWVGMGGLIRAASTGRFAVQYLCDELGMPFRAHESEDAEPWHAGKLGRLPQLDRWSAREGGGAR